MEFGDAAVVARALGTNKRDDIKATLVLGQGEASFGCGPIRLAHLWAGGVETATHLQREPQDRL
jgi:hypothetical protein